MANRKGLNTFNKGMNKDISPIYMPSDTYEDALNMRLSTDSYGKSTGAIEIAPGNALYFKVPSTSKVYEVLIDGTFTGNFDVIVTPPGAPATTITVTGAISKEDWYEQAATAVNAITGVQGAYTKTHLVIWCPDAETYSLSVTNPSASVTITQLIDVIAEPVIVGWGRLRDKLILFTVDEDTPNQSNPVDVASQVWEIGIQKDKYNPTTVINPSNFKLLYNNFLNFSTLHQIHEEGRFESRYENESIERIVFTDWHNSLRNMNIKEPNLFAFDPIDTTSNAPIDLNPIRLNAILYDAGGKVKTGVHNFSYRLSKTNGVSKAFSPVSNNIFITLPTEEGRSFDDNVGGLSELVTSKAIEIKITDIDTDYDTIEVCNIYRPNKGSTPTFKIFKEDLVPSDGELTLVFTDTEPVITEISSDEFNASSLTVKKVKSIAQKNNYLFLGNTSFEKFDLEYDARAYRFRASEPTTIVEDKDGNPTTVDPTGNANWNVPVDHDAIQDYSEQAPIAWNANRLYQENSTVLGGSGPNISYTFSRRGIMISDVPSAGNWPYRKVREESGTYNVDGYDYPYELTRNHRSPYFNGLLRGYMRDEMYRFGIVFYDLFGNPSFTKWIADIRIPHEFMPDTAGAAATRINTNTTISISEAWSTYEITAYNTGVEFTVDITDIKNSISGFSIVRMPRTDNDKIVLGQGQFFNGMYKPTFGTYLYTISGTGYNVTEVNPTYYISSLFGSMQIPESLFSNKIQYATGDYISFVGTQNVLFTQNPVKWTAVWDYVPDGYVVMNYRYNSTPPAALYYKSTNAVETGHYLLDGSTVVPRWGDIRDEFNYQCPTCGSSASIQNRSLSELSEGGKTLLVQGETDAFINFVNALTEVGSPEWYIDEVDGTRKQYVANYCRPRLKQYGGNSYVERSNNVYMSTGHFVKVTPDSPNQVTAEVFGGDTYVAPFDNHKMAKAWYDTPGGTKVQASYFSMLESTINLEMREGAYPNTRTFADDGSGDVGLDLGIEDFKYNEVYSAELEFTSYPSKPFNFNDVEEFDTRIYNTQPKINNETVDSWTIIRPNDYIDVEGQYGSITNLLVFKDRLYYFQPEAFGIVATNERALVQDTTGTELQLGTANVLSRFDYVSTLHGAFHQMGITKTNSNIYFWDQINQNIMVYAGSEGSPISDIKGMHSYLRANTNGTIAITDSPLASQGVVATYCDKTNEVIFSFHGTTGFNDVVPSVSTPDFTLAYNELAAAFTTFYSFCSPLYIKGAGMFASVDPSLTEVWLHNERSNLLVPARACTYYGLHNSASLTFIANEDKTMLKVFDNATMYTQVHDQSTPDGSGMNYKSYPNETWTTVRYTTDNQDTNEQTLDPAAALPIIQKDLQNWNLVIPRNRAVYGAGGVITSVSNTRLSFGTRMKDQYLRVKLKKTPSDNKTLITHWFITKYRHSYSDI